MLIMEIGKLNPVHTEILSPVIKKKKEKFFVNGLQLAPTWLSRVTTTSALLLRHLMITFESSSSSVPSAVAAEIVGSN